MHAACEPKKVQQDGPLEAADDTSLDWYPSADQRYHPVYNPDTQALFYQRLASEAVFAVVKARVHHMDYDRHLTKSVFGPVPPSLDLSRRERVEDRLRLGLSQIEEERQARKEDETTGLSTRVREKMVEDVSLAGIWMQGAVEWQAATEHEERPGIYRLYASIHDFAVSEADESGFVETLRNAGTFRHLRTALDDQYGEVSPMLWHKANDRATKLVNRVLSLNLGLRDCTIDSFTEDFEPMLEALRKMHGEAMVDAFLRHQRTLISAIYRESPEDCREYITSDMCESLPDDAEKPEFTFMSSWSSLTFVNCVSHELGVEWGRGTTAIVTKHAVPLFYQIVKDIMSEARFLAYNLEHSLIQTLDGKIIEIGTAFLADDEGYVVRLVKCM